MKVFIENTTALVGMIVRIIVRIVFFFAFSAGAIAVVYYACFLFGVVDLNQQKSEQSGLANIMQGASAVLGVFVGLWASMYPASWFIGIFRKGHHTAH